MYYKNCEVGLIFKLIRLNFYLKYFYEKGVNTIKKQICKTLTVNLVLMIMQNGRLVHNILPIAIMAIITLISFYTACSIS